MEAFRIHLAVYALLNYVKILPIKFYEFSADYELPRMQKLPYPVNNSQPSASIWFPVWFNYTSQFSDKHCRSLNKFIHLFNICSVYGMVGNKSAYFHFTSHVSLNISVSTLFIYRSILFSSHTDTMVTVSLPPSNWAQWHSRG